MLYVFDPNTLYLLYLEALVKIRDLAIGALNLCGVTIFTLYMTAKCMNVLA